MNTKNISRAVTFTAHYLEMVAAMVVGMVALAPLWHLAWPGLSSHPDIEAITMATDMTVAMAAWMLLRRHPRPAIARMSVAMYLGFALVLPGYWAGLLSPAAMESLGHLLMLLLMLLVLLRHPHRRMS